MDDEMLLELLESPDLKQMTPANAVKLLAKLKSAIERNELYETHQILRTIYFRTKVVIYHQRFLERLLYAGSCTLLRLKEFTSGQDIGNLFLETIAKSLELYRTSANGPYPQLAAHVQDNLINSSCSRHIQSRTFDYEACRKIANIAALLPDSEIGLSKFISETLKILTPKLVNRSLLHETLAFRFWQKDDFVNSRYHYLHCANLENAPTVAGLLVEYQSNCGACKSEIDLFITQFIFQFLCLQYPLDIPSSKPNAAPPLSTITRKTRSTIKSVAEKVFTTYTLEHPSLAQVSIPYSSLPLLNFTYFIISMLDSDNHQQEATKFKMLCDIYKVTWSRDPNYSNYLNRIGTLYFGIIDHARQQRQGGILNNLLMSFLEGTDEEEEDLESNQDGNINLLSSSDELD